MSDLLDRAFVALGQSPTHRELELVAEALQGDQRAMEAIEQAAEDDAAWESLAELAIANGSSGFVALDLLTAITAGPDALTRSDGR